MEKSIFEIGKTYSIHTKGGQRYDDATVNAVDNIFISFIYKKEGLVRGNILNMDVIDSAFVKKNLKAMVILLGLFTLMPFIVKKASLMENK